MNSKKALSSIFDNIRYRLDYDAAIAELGLEGFEEAGELWVSCPLPYGNHKRGDRKPSFSINISDNPKRLGLYNCYVCGGGDLQQLVSEMQGISSEEAYEWLYQFVTSEDEDNLEEEIERMLSETDKPPSTDVLPTFDDTMLFKYRKEHPWMIEQGITREAAKHLQVGYDDERENIIFPHWAYGKLVGWQQRDLTGERRSKYLNTPAFPKKNTLYHLDCDCLDCTRAFVVESPKTVAVLWGRGVHNVVATFGASVSQEQMMGLWRFNEVYLWFDNDDAGRKATRTATKYLENYVDLFVTPVPDFEKADPADIPEGELSEYIDRSISSLLWEVV